MAFRKYANAAIVKPNIHPNGWAEVHQAAVGKSGFGQREAAKVVLQEFDPKDYLLTHCSIIASVDTENGPSPLGKHMVDGFEVNRKYADYYITPETSKYVNNNQDAWEKKLLLSCYRTFIGGENYVEHVQIPELSKGKIIDAAARDIGDSIYVDILVATNRKHAPLIEAITSGQLQTLSMGCQVEQTQCTKCGNVAYDETQLCPHIRYFKGNDFVDEVGKKRKIAELCGHLSDEPGSVRFIEASWVANPAFPGAVMRSILTPEEVSGVGTRMNVAFSESPRVGSGSQKFAYARSAEFGQQEEFPSAGGQGEGAKPATDKPDPLAKAVDSLADLIREKALEKVRGEIGKDDLMGLPSENKNNNLVKEAMRHPEWQGIARVVLGQVGQPSKARHLLAGLVLYRHGGWKMVKAHGGFTGREILAMARLLEMSFRKASRAGNQRIYRTVLAVGGISSYPNKQSYLAACRKLIGRELTASEQADLLVKGYLFSLGS